MEFLTNHTPTSIYSNAVVENIDNEYNKNDKTRVGDEELFDFVSMKLATDIIQFLIIILPSQRYSKINESIHSLKLWVEIEEI